MIRGLTLALLLRWAPALAADDARLALVRQEQIVSARAAEVAAARAEGASRSVMATRMARYRKEAETLAALAAPFLKVDADASVAEHTEASQRLSDALASGTPDSPSRAVLVRWLGEPASRVALLESVIASAPRTPDAEMRRALLLDISDQAGVIRLVTAYDAATARRDAERALTQASALRARTLPGQSGGMDLVIAAERLEQSAAVSSRLVALSVALGARAERIRSTALAALMEFP